MISMDKLTYEQAQKGHRALWNWLAVTGEVSEKLWPGWADYDRRAVDSCFACEQAIDNMCRNCPLLTPDKKTLCDRSDFFKGYGLYIKWRAQTNFNDERAIARRKDLAAQIRDLPWKEKEK